MSEKIEEKKKKPGPWNGADDVLKAQIMDFAEGYMTFLDAAKTEREAVKTVVQMAENAGYCDIASKAELKPGDRVYSVNKNKTVFMAVIGEKPLTEGFNGVGAHIDAPRLDLKQNPLYEDGGLALLKTHYYGGIRKYQWVAMPLALHGVVALTDGSVVDICIGEDEKDPIFLITDLLPHLAAKQSAKKLAEGITAENLNIVIGSMPGAEEEEGVKDHILKILKDKYGIEEEDFRSAEIEAVPAAKARTLGLDGSMVAAYGQDDRICAYPSVVAMLEMEGTPERTAVCILADKEEIGSVGNTGMQSQSFELFIMDMLEKTGIVNPYAVQRTLSASRVLSADVTAAYDPTYPEVMERYNAAYMGKGISIKKYTGARGKSGASDANAEFVGFVRGIFEANGVTYQSSELGKVDEGGGGTIAYILANRGMEVLDCGVPIHSMHSPYESASKYDIYMAYKGYKA
ncbi:MAG: aminopeptidase, partial [Firmicutes bacterium]|nr:aminopeptidase [Bacillota bacterium]